MKHARVTYSNGEVINTSINGTDTEILNYFAVGKEFNIGSVNDNMQKVVKCEIIRKGITANVYFPSYGDCSAGGITSKVKHVTVCGPGVPELSEACEGSPAVRLMEMYANGKTYIRLEPEERPTGNGWMFGGCFAYSSDSRFPAKYPIPIHDRQEF